MYIPNYSKYIYYYQKSVKYENFIKHSEQNEDFDEDEYEDFKVNDNKSMKSIRKPKRKKKKE